MLLRKKRRRRKKSDLLFAQYRLECRAHCDFRLSVADIPTKKPVHRHRLFHVSLDFFRDIVLVGRVLIRKRRVEFSFQIRIFSERKTAADFPLAVQIDEFACHFLRSQLRPLLFAVPRISAELVKFWGISAVSDVTLDEIQLLKRNIKEFFVRIFDFDVVALGLQRLLPLDSLELSDSIIRVDNVIAGIQLHESVDCFAFDVIVRFKSLLSPSENFVFLNDENFCVGNSETGGNRFREDEKLILPVFSIRLENLVHSERLIFIFRKNFDFPAFFQNALEMLPYEFEIAEKTLRCRAINAYALNNLTVRLIFFYCIFV